MHKREIAFAHEFVEFIPPHIQEGILYISLPYATAVHKCFCGCGNEVVTPLSSTDWRLTFDGTDVSLHPSIGNWSFKCKSHYWIKNSKVTWAEAWTKERIEIGRAYDRYAKTPRISDHKKHAAPEPQEALNVSNPPQRKSEPGFLAKLWKAIFG